MLNLTAKPQQHLLKFMLTLLLIVVSMSQVQANENLIDLNKAGALSLIELENMPISLATAIVKHRKEFGPFKAVKDMLKVPGMSEALLKKINPELKKNGELIAIIIDEEHKNESMDIPVY